MGPHYVLVNAAELQKPTHTSTLDGKPFVQIRRALQIFSWVLQFWLCIPGPWGWDLLARSTVVFWPGFAVVIYSSGESLLGSFNRLFSSFVSLTALTI